jgi:regulator of RNase E activity RraA
MSASGNDLPTEWQALYSPVIGDVLDALGYQHQFMPAAVQPMRSDMLVIGRAMPVLLADVFGEQDQPFGLLTEALDQVQAGEVFICAGGARRCAYWGEILTATARTRGAAGAVIDGYHRDTPRVLEQDWPVFSRGRFAQDSRVRTRVIGYRTTVEVEGVRVDPGDVVFGDLDGVVFIPRAVEAEVLDRALAKASAENTVRRAIEAGLSSTEAFARYGVL